MNFQAEQLIARLRPPGIRLFWPFLALLTSATLVGFYSGRLTEQWQNILVFSLAGILSFFGWLLPLLNHLTHVTEVSTSRLKSRSGLFGLRRREVSFSRVVDVQVGQKRTVVVTVQGDEPLVLSRISKPKFVAAELRAIASQKRGL